MELQGIARVFTHYTHHVVSHGESDLGFFEFLADHFSSSSRPDPEHSQLPFHTSTTAHAPIVYVPAPVTVLNEPPTTHQTHGCILCEGTPQKTVVAVFQPPRA